MKKNLTKKQLWRKYAEKNFEYLLKKYSHLPIKMYLEIEGYEGFIINFSGPKNELGNNQRDFYISLTEKEGFMYVSCYDDDNSGIQKEEIGNEISVIKFQKNILYSKKIMKMLCAYLLWEIEEINIPMLKNYSNIRSNKKY